jgi:hypothetical protein
MLSPMLGMPILHYVFNIRHCIMRVVGQIVKLTVCYIERLEEMRYFVNSSQFRSCFYIHIEIIF